jgi:hypothetical protein
MQKKIWILALVVAAVMLIGSAAWADDLYVIAGGGKAGTQINSVPYTINSSGLYCLGRDLTSTENGIIVAASDVTLDLMGFSLTGPGKTVGTYDGVRVSAGFVNVEIRNGSIRQFSFHGVTMESPADSGVRAIGLRVRDNGAGILLQGANSLALCCSAMFNGQYGIYVGPASMVKNNQAYQNTGNGIVAGLGCRVSGNLAYGNSSNGMNVQGNSTVSQNTAATNIGVGIATLGYCTITNNTTTSLSNGVNCTLANNTVGGL